MNEVWKTVPGWDKYEVSNLGRVRRAKPGKSTRVGKVLRPALNTCGYEQVKLCDNGREWNVRVHRLVAIAFLGNRSDTHTDVNHIDGDKLNNSASNLEWCTRGDNIRHAHANGLASDRKGESHPRAKLNEMQVRVIRRCVELGLPHGYIAEVFGIHKSAPSHIASRRIWSHV